MAAVSVKMSVQFNIKKKTFLNFSFSLSLRHPWSLVAFESEVRGTGVGTQEKRGRGVYGRRDSRGGGKRKK